MKTLKLTEALDEALVMATIGHSRQKDLGGNKYILHPLRVMHNCKGIKAKIVALLHDTIEDGHYTLEDFRSKGFSEEIINAIDAISRRPEEKYSDYINRLSKNDIAVHVKIEDIKDNMDLSRLKKETDKSSERINKYTVTLDFLELIVRNKLIASLSKSIENGKETMEDIKKKGFPFEMLDTLDALTRRRKEKRPDYLERLSKNETAVRIKIEEVKNEMDLSGVKNVTENVLNRNKERAATINFLESSINKNEQEGLCP